MNDYAAFYRAMQQMERDAERGDRWRRRQGTPPAAAWESAARTPLRYPNATDVAQIEEQTAEEARTNARANGSLSMADLPAGRIRRIGSQEQRQIEIDTDAEAARQQARREYSALPDQAGIVTPIVSAIADPVEGAMDRGRENLGIPGAREDRIARDRRWARGARQASEDILDEGHGGQLMDWAASIPEAMRQASENRAEADRGRELNMYDRSLLRSVAEPIGDFWTGMSAVGRDARGETAAEDARRNYARRDYEIAAERGVEAANAGDMQAAGEADIAARSAARTGRTAEQRGDASAGTDFWANAPWALEFAPEFGMVQSLARFPARVGLRAAGQEVPEALARPNLLSETQAAGPATRNAQGWRNNALLGGGAYLAADAADGNIGDDPGASLMTAGGAMALGRRFIPNIDSAIPADITHLARQGEVGADGARNYTPRPRQRLTVDPEGRVAMDYEGSFNTGDGASVGETRSVIRGARKALDRDIADTRRSEYSWTPNDERQAALYRGTFERDTPTNYAFSETPQANGQPLQRLRRLGAEFEPDPLQAQRVPDDAPYAFEGAPRAPEIIDAEATPTVPRNFEAAVRDPETGRVYTGEDHNAAIDSIPDETTRARLQALYDAPTEDPGAIGFNVNGQFMGREEGLQSLRSQRRPVRVGEQVNRDGSVTPRDPINWDAGIDPQRSAMADLRLGIEDPGRMSIAPEGGAPRRLGASEGPDAGPVQGGDDPFGDAEWLAQRRGGGRAPDDPSRTISPQSNSAARIEVVEDGGANGATVYEFDGPQGSRYRVRVDSEDGARSGTANVTFESVDRADAPFAVQDRFTPAEVNEVYRNVQEAIAQDARSYRRGSYAISGVDKERGRLHQAMIRRAVRRGEMPEGFAPNYADEHLGETFVNRTDSNALAEQMQSANRRRLQHDGGRWEIIENGEIVQRFPRGTTFRQANEALRLSRTAPDGGPVHAGRAPDDAASRFSYEGPNHNGARIYTVQVDNNHVARMEVHPDEIVQWSIRSIDGGTIGDLPVSQRSALALKALRGVQEALGSDARQFGVTAYTFYGDQAHSAAYRAMGQNAERYGFEMRETGPGAFELRQSPNRTGPNAGPRRLGDNDAAAIAGVATTGAAGAYTADQLFNQEANASDGTDAGGNPIVPILGAGASLAALEALRRGRLAPEFADNVGMSGGRAESRPRRLGQDPVAELNDVGAQSGNGARTEADISQAWPTDPEQWREVMGTHPWINSPSRAQLVLMASARDEAGRFLYSAEDIAARAGLASPESLNVLLSRARSAGVDIPTRPKGGGGATRMPGGNRLNRAVEVLESAVRSGEPMTYTTLDERMRIRPGSSRAWLANALNNPAVPDALKARIRAAIEANPRTLGPRRGDALDAIAPIGIGAGATALAFSDDAEASSDEDVINRGRYLEARAGDEDPKPRIPAEMRIAGAIGTGLIARNAVRRLGATGFVGEGAGAAAAYGTNRFLGGDPAEAGMTALATPALRYAGQEGGRRLAASIDEGIYRRAQQSLQWTDYDHALANEPMHQQRVREFAASLPGEAPSARAIQAENYHVDVPREANGMAPFSVGDREAFDQGYSRNIPGTETQSPRDEFLAMTPGQQEAWMNRQGATMIDGDPDRAARGLQVQQMVRDTPQRPRLGAPEPTRGMPPMNRPTRGERTPSAVLRRAGSRPAGQTMDGFIEAARGEGVEIAPAARNNKARAAAIAEAIRQNPRLEQLARDWGLAVLLSAGGVAALSADDAET